MKRSKIFLLIILMTHASVYSQNNELPNYVQKKINNTLEDLWQDKSLKINPIEITTEQLANTNIESREIDISRIYSQNVFVGYMCIANATGRYEEFTYMVIFKPDLSILTVQVLHYQENYGGEIGSKKWLAQFAHLDDVKNAEFGRDIKNISGATISARSITEGIKRLSVIMDTLFILKIIQ